MLTTSLLGVIFLINLPEVLGGGHDLIIKLTEKQYTLKLLLLILVIKFVYTLISYSSSAPGGIFLPMLVIGSLIGNIYALILIKLFNLDSIYNINFVVLGMAGYFASVVRAPITGIILITELVGSFNYILPLSLASFTSYVVAEFLREEPIYEVLLDRLLGNKLENKELGLEAKKRPYLKYK
ncbi:chloride channel protein [Caloramator sp. mosi_1]|uniref:chloride channel protein n=1 Tax=Caloramator sp. mosi_1 TaxID=3023090 RepID=UPI002360A347|nr:chloride channel protein [Caloramator sp. mosi_1]WDC83431.1 chloride channel protein [Caloramator sp. mosi_1]